MCIRKISRICLLLFSKKYVVCILLNMTLFVGSQSFISLQSFMFVSAPVNEITRVETEEEEEGGEEFLKRL